MDDPRLTPDHGNVTPPPPENAQPIDELRAWLTRTAPLVARLLWPETGT